MTQRSDTSLPGDVAGCHRLIGELADQLNKERLLVERMQHQLEMLLKARYGPRSDRLAPGQTLLCEMGPVAEEAAAEQDKQEKTEEQPEPGRKRNGGRRPLPKHLPREEVIVQVDESERVCQSCQVEKKCIGYETSEQLEYVPASMKVLVEKREKLACPKPDCPEFGGVVTAAKPVQPIEKGLAGPGLLAYVVVSKYNDHLPLHRLEGIFRREGVELSRKTMCDWMAQAAQTLRPLYELEKQEVLTGRIIRTDDTPVPVQDPAYPKRTKTGRIWIYRGDRAHPFDVYAYTPNRKRDGPLHFLGDYAGYLQADAYGGYDAVYAGDKVIEVGCWAHARRRFTDAQGTDAVRAAHAVANIKRLYEIEREIKGRSAAERLAARQEQSRPILAEILNWMEQEKIQVLPKSPMGEAITYALNQWVALTRYTEDGELEIDNNGAEQGMRGVALGRKNWLFAGSDNGGRTAAVLYTVIKSALRHHVNVFEYLRDVLARINALPHKQLPDLLPNRWRKLREQAAADPAAT